MRNIAVLAALLLVLPLAAQTPPSQVTIPLDAYDTLRRTQEAPAATVIDTILLSGGFGEKNLAITFSGRSTGTRPLVKAMEQTNDVTISGCKGDAIVSRSGKGAFDVVPLAGTFEVRCELRISGSDRLRMHVTPGVLAVRSNVADAELVTGDEDEAGARDYTLVRHVAGPGGETLAATATGRYLITLLPDATRFRYAIDVHNPNRTTSALELLLQSNEHLQQIDSAAPYEVSDRRYVFSIPPGDSAITLTGELRGTSFVAPVRASLQYLVLESHPLLRPTVQTPAKRISLGETGVTPQYRGALAFETGTERIAWQVTRLQALHAISYAVNDATHRVFIPVDGPLLGETAFSLRNEGAPELVLPAVPEPTYVSLTGEPVLMTKNAAGQLTVPLSQGAQEVLVQHRQPLWRKLGLAAGRVSIPQLDVPATDTTLLLIYPAQWVPLYESFAAKARIWSPDGGQILLFVVLALWIERLLAWLGYTVRRRLTIAVATALAATIVTTLLALVVVVFGVLTAIWIAAQPVRPRIGYAILGVLATVALLFYVTVVSDLQRSVKYGSGSSSYEQAVTDTSAGNTARSDAHGVVKVEGRIAEVSYQGLPAKFILPGGTRASTFTQELLRVDRPQKAIVIAISSALVNWLGILLALLPIAMLFNDRHRIAATLAERRRPRVVVADAEATA
jgi:hypothetical protein